MRAITPQAVGQEEQGANDEVHRVCTMIVLSGFHSHTAAQGDWTAIVTSTSGTTSGS